MTIKEQLINQDMWSSSEKIIADYILKNKDKVITMSIQELSKETYASTASIVRFCRKLGLDGFSDFKIQFATQLQKKDEESLSAVNPDFPIDKNDSFFELSQKIYDLTKESLTITYQRLNVKEFEKATKLMLGSKRVAIFAVGDSFIRALSFQNKMLKLNFPILMTTLPSENSQLANVLTKNDCAIIISYSGESRDIVNTVRILAKRKIPIISVTSSKKSTLGKWSQIILQTIDNESKSVKYSNFASQTSIELILNTLYSCFFLHDYEINSNQRIEAETYFMNSQK